MHQAAGSPIACQSRVIRNLLIGRLITAFTPSGLPVERVSVAIMADDASKKRTFRKFTYRGVDLEQLLDLGTDELVQLYHARVRRK